MRETPAGHFMFNLLAENGQVILTSEVYTSRQAVLDGIESVRYNSQVELRFERRIAADDSACFLLTAPNGKVIGRSGKYSNALAMEDRIKSVMASGSTKVIRRLAEPLVQDRSDRGMAAA